MKTIAKRFYGQAFQWKTVESCIGPSFPNEDQLKTKRNVKLSEWKPMKSLWKVKLSWWKPMETNVRPSFPNENQWTTLVMSSLPNEDQCKTTASSSLPKESHWTTTARSRLLYGTLYVWKSIVKSIFLNGSQWKTKKTCIVKANFPKWKPMKQLL